MLFCVSLGEVLTRMDDLKPIAHVAEDGRVHGLEEHWGGDKYNLLVSF